MTLDKLPEIEIEFPKLPRSFIVAYAIGATASVVAFLAALGVVVWGIGVAAGKW
jgi:hypothetical protein